jgi:hypothetical protein
MLTLYLVCLAFGGILLLVSVFSGDLGGDADVDFGHDLDLGPDVDLGGHDVDAAGHDLDAAHTVDHSGHGLQNVFQYLSFRALVFFLAFFGLTGSILTALGSWWIVTFPVAAVMGIASGAGIQWALRYLQRTESGQGSDLKHIEGSRARVLLECTRDRRGKILVDVHQCTMQLLALVADEASRDSFATGETVIVVSVLDGVAYVSGEDLVM